ncbi:MAG: methylmalonyl Co-A mutase-associated GTPase MeaB [Saprospiraceae bacterium]
MDHSETPQHLNPNLRKRLAQRQVIEVDQYIEEILAGNLVFLSQAITLIESQQAKHQEKAQAILAACLPHSGKSRRIGITGSPGVGKSTFIEALGQQIIEQGHRVAVLAVDPSSPVSKGSILGDKTRMSELSLSDQAFIRPSPAGNALGGVAQKTRETILLCEAAGFDYILLETVGVGQSEVAVHAMTDLFLLLLLPGAGDELQGIKRGIVEMADLLVINKAEGDRMPLAKEAQRAYRHALHLFPVKASGWNPPVLTCSALQKERIDTVLKQINNYFSTIEQSAFLQNNRKEQATFWLKDTIEQQLQQLFQEHPDVQAQLHTVEAQVRAEAITPFQGAEMLLKLFR